MVVEGDDSFKRPGAVPFNWEIRPGVPKIRPDDDDDYDADDDPTLLLPPLRLKPVTPPSADPPISDYKRRAVSPFAPPPSSLKLKPPPDPYSPHCSGPPTPYFRSYSPRDGLGFGSASRRWRFLKSLFASKKGNNVKKTTTGDEESPSSESDNFYESETTFSTSEDSSRGSVSTRWSSPKSSLSSLRGSPLKRNQSDLSSYEKKSFIMLARDRLA